MQSCTYSCMLRKLLLVSNGIHKTWSLFFSCPFESCIVIIFPGNVLLMKLLGGNFFVHTVDSFSVMFLLY